MDLKSVSFHSIVLAVILALLFSPILPPSANAADNPQLLFVLDISGSMGDRVGGVVKLEAAKSAVHAIAPGLSSKGLDLGMMHFAGCGNVSYPLPPGPKNSGRISQIINGLSPGGGTPLAAALQRAGQQLRGGSTEKRIILLSDGKETCGGDPVAEVARFASDKLKVHVIGFDVGTGAVSQLRKIANAGGGVFTEARSAQELRKAFEDMAEDLEEDLLEEMRSCVELGGGNPTEENSSLHDPETNNQDASWEYARSVAEQGWSFTQWGVAELSRLTAVSTAYAQNLPGWVQDPTSQYPEDQYLTAVGSGAALSGAKNKAKQNLLEIFSQEIKASETMREVTREVSSNKGNEFSQKLDIQTEIDVQSTGELIGAKIEKSKSVFQDGRTTYYALAVLNIGQAISSYEDRLDEARRKLDRIYGLSERSDDSLNKLRYLTTARQHAADALKYKGYLSVLRNLGGSSSSSGSGGMQSRADDFRRSMESSQEDGSSGSSPSPGSISPKPSDIDSELETVFRNISISLGGVKLSNICEGTRFDNQMKRNISEQFTNIGFRTESGTDGLVVVDGRLSANYTTRARKSDKAIRWNLTLNLKNTETGRTFATINENRVTTGLDKAHAASRTRFEITEWIKDNMNKTITDKLLST